MRRGFLNKPKRPKARANATSPAAEELKETQTPDSESQETPPRTETPKPTSPYVEEYNDPPLNPHLPPQWLLDTRSKGETRFVFRQWPRAPGGADAFESEPGKMAPNGIPKWGATLYDFFNFRLFPDIASCIATSTSSRLAATMRSLGELDAAAHEIAWADREEDPHQLVPPDEIARDIEPLEERIMGGGRVPWATGGGRSVRSSEHKRAVEVPLPEAAPDEHCDIADIKPENYPGPWPQVPFSVVGPQLPKLETLIPYTLLPKKLIVHDPWNLLAMPYELEADLNTDWTQMPDITHTYELQPLTPAGLSKSDHHHVVFRSRIDESDLLIAPSLNPNLYEASCAEGSCSPLLKIKVPPYPHKNATPAAHLYLSPASKAGVGNHSVVYHAEWELPRALLVPDVFCQACLAQELRDMDKSGALAKLIADALAAADEPCFLKEELEIVPEHVVDVSDRSANADAPPDIRIITPSTIERTRTYRGPVVDIHTTVQWQTPGRGTNCEHLQKDSPGPRPPTATVRVCAKLSIEDDAHLAREATVYQALPAHLAEHWSGYNLVRPSHNPVPVRAVVPQFYGYYAPVPAPDPEAAYLSPVMLLENCGVPLEARVLSADERAECWSLVYRLHHAGWAHGSVAARNIVVQPGPMTAPQGWLRGPELSFRVIDFGRSLYCGAKADSDGAEDVHEGFRPRGDANETIRLEKDLVDRLLSQGIHGS